MKFKQYLAMKTTDIRTNLATEQYLMNSDEIKLPCMLFYIEKPCIIVGRNQNTMEEINDEYCRKHNIVVTRRLSGGGAMYQDLGNLCFSFILPANDEEFGEFKDVVKPVVDALHAMGATGAEINGRNDITIDGKKFSGNAMYTRKGRTFSHGTLMYNVNINAVTDALKVSKDKIESKGIKSVRSRVINIKLFLDPQYQASDTFDFRDELITKIFGTNTIEEAEKEYSYHLTPADKEAIAKIQKERYDNWDWVYGNSPKFTVKKRKHFTAGTIDARFLVEKGIIKNLKIYGDFFGIKDVSDLEKQLIGKEYDANVIQGTLEKDDLDQYFHGIPAKDVIDLIALQH